VRDPNGMAISQKTGTTKHFLVADRLGSTYALATPAGAIARSYGYDVDGNDTPDAAGAPQTDLRYAGGHKLTSGSASLYHFGARYYDPGIARWTQQDPLEQYADLTQANRYAYVGGDPINSTDLDGLRPDARGRKANCVWVGYGYRCVGSGSNGGLDNIDRACIAAGFGKAAKDIWDFAKKISRRASIPTIVIGIACTAKGIS
jgi:RHS repeat-associated protein